ncbi:hypothetical protein CHS0354_002831 [Potamilus streckersoni]|uniref:Uncharacterized protein n=1 Tax=Potamilus streckersoni TaxID=2493646 RepID=A0AAE0RMN6_9BIVA|nr:hypothetical protein CHS0354_002831 [Potamilus streckersoni]
MADAGDETKKDAEENTEENGLEETRRSLEDFVTDHYNQQMDEGKMDATDEICDERTAKFFSRALAESRRMNAEVQKSNRKSEKLHTELGAERYVQWQAEHASEVLLPHEVELVKDSQYQ